MARGPVLYRTEGADHPGVDLRDLELHPNLPLDASWEPDFLSGVVTLRGTATVRSVDPGWRERHYSTAGTRARRGEASSSRLAAIPYLAWGNRAPGAMRVWLRRSTSP